MTEEQKLEHAKHYRDQLWRSRMDLSEDKRLAHLDRLCAELCGGDRAAGLQLARDAIWS